MATALSCVVLLCDGPPTVMGTLLSDFWEALGDDDDAICDFLKKNIRDSDALRDLEFKHDLVRAGHVTMFPLGIEEDQGERTKKT